MRLGPPSDGVFRAMLDMDVERADLRGDFLRRVFGAAERIRLHMELGTAVHCQCELRIGDSVVHIFQSSEGPPPCPLLGQLIVRDSEAMFARAMEAGACAVVEINDTLLGTRAGRLIDPFGNAWTILAQADQSLDR